MGYKAVYGFQNLDCMTEFDVKTRKKEDCTLNFLCMDCQGTIRVSSDYKACDVCGDSMYGKAGYLHGSYLYCDKCETIHRKNEHVKRAKDRIERIKKRIHK